MHHEMRRQQGELVPYNITAKDLEEISLQTSQHQKYMTYLLKTELAKFHRQLKKAISPQKRAEIIRINREKKMATSGVLILRRYTWNSRICANYSTSMI